MKLYRFEPPQLCRIDSLKNNKLWVAQPESFNDPLDCNLTTKGSTDFSTFKEENIRDATKRLYKNYDLSNGLWLLDAKIIQGIETWAKGEDYTPQKPHFLSLIEKRVNKFGVQCFCKNGLTNPLMWAHYADNHKGFCIEYEYNPREVACCQGGKFAMYPVSYTSKLPKFSLNEVVFAPKEMTEKLLATKSTHWAYENEYRLIYFPCKPQNNKSGELVSIPTGLKVTKIISGLNFKGNEEVTEDKLTEIAKELEIEHLKIKHSELDYSLEAKKTYP
ncbi:DUF2971 domain-containing protein [Kangiella shandongensis]|uniref:DUF2971 domain-containing protein n=1 Tax=Kangiella shandongensis TaxID=2763258 RepID=UPI001CBC13C4|nr:DUF2971 domain-containing protein [Kangiella shandongensis]